MPCIDFGQHGDFLSSSDNYGYEVESSANGLYNLNWRSQSSMWGSDAEKVSAEIKQHDNILRVKVKCCKCDFDEVQDFSGLLSL